MENQIKTFDDACKALNLDPTKLPDVSMLQEKHHKSVTAHYKLMTIAEALNEGWQPNWSNSNEWKYYPWFDMDAEEKDDSGVGFSYHRYGHDRSFTTVGSRLCYKSAELAEYAGTQFRDLYKDLMVLE